MLYAPLILGAMSLIEKLLPMIQQWRVAAKQNAELNETQDADLDTRIQAMTQQAHWQIQP